MGGLGKQEMRLPERMFSSRGGCHLTMVVGAKPNDKIEDSFRQSQRCNHSTNEMNNPLHSTAILEV